MALKHEGLTGQIIKSFYKVYNELGFGFLEKVYENDLALELESMGLLIGRQAAGNQGLLPWPAGWRLLRRPDRRELGHN